MLINHLQNIGTDIDLYKTWHKINNVSEWKSLNSGTPANAESPRLG